MAGSASRRRRWEAALAAFRGAEARLADFAACVARLAPERRAFPACEPLEDRYDDLECARLAALRRLLRAPAPNLAAFSLKIDLAIDDQAWELTGAELCLAALKADGRRLAQYRLVVEGSARGSSAADRFRPSSNPPGTSSEQR